MPASLSAAYLARLNKIEGPDLKEDLEFLDRNRPDNTDDCPINEEHFCPFVGCRYHLYLETNGTNIKFLHPGKEVWELEETCALRVANRGPHPQEEIAPFFGLTRQSFTKTEESARRKLEACLTS